MPAVLFRCHCIVLYRTMNDTQRITSICPCCLFLFYSFIDDSNHLLNTCEWLPRPIYVSIDVWRICFPSKFQFVFAVLATIFVWFLKSSFLQFNTAQFCSVQTSLKRHHALASLCIVFKPLCAHAVCMSLTLESIFVSPTYWTSQSLFIHLTHARWLSIFVSASHFSSFKFCLTISLRCCLWPFEITLILCVYFLLNQFYFSLWWITPWSHLLPLPVLPVFVSELLVRSICVYTCVKTRIFRATSQCDVYWHVLRISHSLQ